ncbi:NADH dehydrogenase [Candidatus Riesia sp. GBBU]|nr:NADH dehydrogenase [Candidatus Riesia sp. GBBU]
MKTLKKVIVVGGGAGGLKLVTMLGNKLGKKKLAEIILVDKNKTHVWKPLLHEVASGYLDCEKNEISYFVHSKKNHFIFKFGSLLNIDRENKLILLKEIKNKNGKTLVRKRKIFFDILVIATGGISNDFNIPGVKKHCMFLDNLNQAKLFHKKILESFFILSNKKEKLKKISIAIVGGGATGIELSAELYNLIKYLNKYKFDGKSFYVINVILIESEDRILPSLPEKISKLVSHRLTKIGVCILTKTTITSVEKNTLNTKNEKKISADIIVWAAGVKVPDFMKNIGGLITNKINQLIIKSTLQTTIDNSIFSIGDCSSCKQDNGFVPPRAQAASQMAKLCCENIVSLIRNKPLKKYSYIDRGFIISLSEFDVIGNLIITTKNKPILIQGKTARLIYHLLYKIHQISIFGFCKTFLMAILSIINRIIHSKLKFH